LQHGKLRHARSGRFAVAAAELGNEPPLSVDGSTGPAVDRRRVSIQWFSGTILTGLCGAALMSGAVFAALDGESTFAAVPERIDAALRGAVGALVSSHKGDRLPPPAELASARQVVKVSQTIKAGSRELVRVRPYIRVASNLALSTSELSANIPPFNPTKLMAESDDTQMASDQSSEAAPDAEVSFVTRDLGPLLGKLKIAATVPIEDVLMQVHDASNWSTNSAPSYSLATATSAKLAYAAEDPKADPYAGFETRIVPENITLLAKTKQQVDAAVANERVISVKKGDTAASLLKDLGATQDETRNIAALLASHGRDGGLKEGQKLKVLMSPAPGQRMQPARVMVIGDSGPEAVVALSDMGKYVSVDVQSMETQQVASNDDDDDDDDGSGVRLYQSIYETALRNQIPRAAIDELIRVYSYDVDFQRKTQAGDSFEVLYSGEDESGSEKPEVQYAALTVGGETKKYYRFQSPDDGVVDYYDDTGKSAKKFLVRKPVASAIMRSGFGSRRHPILGYTKVHTGVDWAAPMGTPIFASGNGEVEKAQWEGGYGKYIRIKHANGYETAYGHMSAFARGIGPGSKVHQGQLIGFVGSTGLSTGAHVHYEILVNGRFVDPMRIRLPRGRSLDGPLLANFETERDRLDNIMKKMPARIASATR
jgi:murein DD-endopeptidase MepM/ murein hydrolase activator NlpD